MPKKKLEACAQALFRKRKTWLDQVAKAVGDEPTHLRWDELPAKEQQEYEDEARLVLRTWGVEL